MELLNSFPSHIEEEIVFPGLGTRLAFHPTSGYAILNNLPKTVCHTKAWLLALVGPKCVPCNHQIETNN